MCVGISPDSRRSGPADIRRESEAYLADRSVDQRRNDRRQIERPSRQDRVDVQAILIDVAEDQGVGVHLLRGRGKAVGEIPVDDPAMTAGSEAQGGRQSAGQFPDQCARLWLLRIERGSRRPRGTGEVNAENR